MGAFLTTAAEPDTGSGSAEARIRSATLSCIARFGLAKTTLDDVARQSGLSRATIYRVFPGGRDTLFEAVLTAEVHRFFWDLAAELDRHDGLEDLLIAGLGESMRFLVEHEALHAVVTYDPALLLPQLAFHRLEGVITAATAFATPYLEPHVASYADAVSGAEHLVRIVLSYTLAPSGRVDPFDDTSIRALVHRHVLPALRSTTAPPLTAHRQTAHAPVRTSNQKDQP